MKIKVSIADIALNKITMLVDLYNKAFKDWNVYVKISHKKCSDKIRYKVQHSVKENVLNNVPAKYTRNSKYIRLSENLYKHGLDEVYKVVKYSKEFSRITILIQRRSKIILSGK
jgi:hypothetical protein